MTQNNDSRAAFEAWAKKEHGWVQEALNALWDGREYQNTIFQLNWVAWQARQPEINALKARIAELEAQTTLQPIATAPKDGTELQLYVAVAWPRVNIDEDEPRIGNGLYSCGAFWWDAGTQAWRSRLGKWLKEPTHWTHLPVPARKGE